MLPVRVLWKMVLFQPLARVCQVLIGALLIASRTSQRSPSMSTSRFSNTRAEIGYDAAEDARRFTVSESGIVVVPRSYKF